jgi:hypothetical protein
MDKITTTIEREWLAKIADRTAARVQPAFVTSTVEKITKAPARTFLEWVTDNIAEFRRAN